MARSGSKDGRLTLTPYRGCIARDLEGWRIVWVKFMLVVLLNILEQLREFVQELLKPKGASNKHD
jgi:EamA domain-containing membrane protein RarD